MSEQMLYSDKLNEVTVPDCRGASVKPGDRVRLRGRHPHAGRIGIYEGVEYLQALNAFRPLVRFEDGQGCYVQLAKEWEGARARGAPDGTGAGKAATE